MPQSMACSNMCQWNADKKNNNKNTLANARQKNMNDKGIEQWGQKFNKISSIQLKLSDNKANKHDRDDHHQVWCS